MCFTEGHKTLTLLVWIVLLRTDRGQACSFSAWWQMLAGRNEAKTSKNCHACWSRRWDVPWNTAVSAANLETAVPIKWSWSLNISRTQQKLPCTDPARETMLGEKFQVPVSKCVTWWVVAESGCVGEHMWDTHWRCLKHLKKVRFQKRTEILHYAGDDISQWLVGYSSYHGLICIYKLVEAGQIEM